MASTAICAEYLMAWIMVVIDNIDIIDINTALKHSTWPFIIKDKYSAHTRIIRLY